jgi:putative oxidoreductase
MKVATIIARILLGLIFVVFGANAFLHFLPMPPLPQNVAGDYVRVFMVSGYVYVIGFLEVVGGFGPIIVNILIFHALMAPEGFPPALVVTALELFLLWSYRAVFAPLLRA